MVRMAEKERRMKIDDIRLVERGIQLDLTRTQLLIMQHLKIIAGQVGY